MADIGSKVFKVVIIGPESTGKSTLCRMLADHFKTRWCPEYAREYLEKFGSAYRFPDLLNIAKGQLNLEEQFLQKMISEQGENSAAMPPDSPPLILFMDTDQYVMKVWCEYVFGDCHNWILRRIAERPYDLYLLCKPDLPWVKDDLREYPDEKPRQELYHMYRDLLINQSIPWVEVSGNYQERFELAKAGIEEQLILQQV